MKTIDEETEARITFALSLRTYREIAGFSQRGLAKRIGADHTYISHLEGGRRGASFRTIILLAAALGIKPGQLFEEVESED